MRVAIINSVYANGSTGKIVREIEKCLIAGGHECKCFYGRKSGNENGGEFFGSKFSVLSHAFFSRVFGKHGLYSRRATKQLIKKLKNFNPDVINLHNIHGYYLNYKILFKYLKEANVPVVWTLHDLWPITGHCAYFDEDKCVLEKGCKKCGSKKAYPNSLFDNTSKNYKLKKELFTSLNNLTLVCPCEWIKDILKGSFLKDVNAEVINNGIDLDKFERVDSDFARQNNLENKKILLGVSLQWTERKGLSEFNKLASELSDEYKIVLVGVENNQQVHSNIFSIGKTQSLNELVEIYSASSLFVNPTFMDNFPTVNIEALACGLPVITYATGGSAEIIDDTCGTSVPKGKYELLKSAIINFDYKIKTADNCRKRAECFDSKDKFNRYIDLFLEVVK